jgi:hypothetical protein
VTPSLTSEGAELSLSPLRVASLDDGRMERLWNVMKKGLLAGDTLR